MPEILFREGELQSCEQSVVTVGFLVHSQSENAPEYRQLSLNWTLRENGELVGVLTAKSLWDWLYIDELWVSDSCRGQGLGKKLMAEAEQYARSKEITGLWLWTQSWQAGGFYERLGFEKFATFPDFPKGHQRIGFRKFLAAS